MPFLRIDREDGEMEEKTEQEVRDLLANYWRDIDLCIDEMKRGTPMWTPFADYMWKEGA